LVQTLQLKLFGARLSGEPRVWWEIIVHSSFPRHSFSTQSCTKEFQLKSLSGETRVWTLVHSSFPRHSFSTLVSTKSNSALQSPRANLDFRALHPRETRVYSSLPNVQCCSFLLFLETRVYFCFFLETRVHCCSFYRLEC